MAPTETKPSEPTTVDVVNPPTDAAGFLGAGGVAVVAWGLGTWAIGTACEGASAVAGCAVARGFGAVVFALGMLLVTLALALLRRPSLHRRVGWAAIGTLAALAAVCSLSDRYWGTVWVPALFLIAPVPLIGAWLSLAWLPWPRARSGPG